MKPLKRSKNLTERTVDTLRNAIVNDEFMLGEPLSETLLSESLGISKSPVREALAQLKAEGLVTIIPQKGTFVFTLTPEELSELIQMRYILESAALRLSFQYNKTRLIDSLVKSLEIMEEHLLNKDQAQYLKLDAVFHEVLFDLCGNQYLREAYRQIAGKQAALRLRSAKQPKHTDKTYQDHSEFVQCLQQNRLDDALDILKAHFSETEKVYSENLASIAVSNASSTRASRRSRDHFSLASV